MSRVSHHCICLSLSSRTSPKNWLELFQLCYTPQHFPGNKNYSTPHFRIFPPSVNVPGSVLGGHDFGLASMSSCHCGVMCMACSAQCSSISQSYRPWPSWTRVGSAGMVFSCPLVISAFHQVPVGPIHMWRESLES